MVSSTHYAFPTINPDSIHETNTYTVFLPFCESLGESVTALKELYTSSVFINQTVLIVFPSDIGFRALENDQKPSSLPNHELDKGILDWHTNLDTKTFNSCSNV